MTKEFSFTQELTLPSQGLLNPEIPGGIVTQRCLMVKDQKTLLGSNKSAGSAIQDLIQKTIVSPEGFDASKLTMSDTLYLLFKLRVISYGESYKFRTRCPICGNKIDVEVNLADLPVRTLSEDYEDNLVVVLPHRGDTVHTKLLTNEDSEYMSQELKRRKKRNPNDDSEYVLRIVQSIKEIELAKPNADGKKTLTSSFEIERYVENLTDLDARIIVDNRDSIAYGIDPIIEYVCPECHEDIEVSVAYSSDFFRPSTSR